MFSQDAEKICRRRARTREAYLVKRRSFPDSDASRFTNDEVGLLRGHQWHHRRTCKLHKM